jgi:hypothetical protein
LTPLSGLSTTKCPQQSLRYGRLPPNRRKLTTVGTQRKNIAWEGSNPCYTTQRSFLDLPLELRNIVYSYCLPQNSTFRISFLGQPSLNKGIPYTNTALTRTCKQVHAETCQILYGENTFRLEPCGDIARSHQLPDSYKNPDHQLIPLLTVARAMIPRRYARFVQRFQAEYCNCTTFCDIWCHAHQGARGLEKAFPNLLKVLVIIGDTDDITYPFLRPNDSRCEIRDPSSFEYFPIEEPDMNEVTTWIKETCRASGVKVAKSVVLCCYHRPYGYLLTTLQLGLEEYRRRSARIGGHTRSVFRLLHWQALLER